MKDTHRQCFMRGANGATYVAWLPSELARVGAYYRIDGVNSFYITEVYAPELPSDYVHERSRDYKKQRLASDL